MSHTHDEYNEVLKLRHKNKSYSQIQKITKISKSTLSDWLSDVEWSVKIKQNLTTYHSKNYKLNVSKSIEARTKLKILRDNIYIEEAKELYGIYKHEALFNLGLGLYWGEGNKKTGWSVGVTNTDPNLLRIIVKFFRKYIRINNGKLRIHLFLYSDINEQTAVNFWSSFLEIPKTQFIKSQQLESRAKLTKTKSKYGVCSLYFTSTEFHIKIMHWLKLASLNIAGLA